MFALIALVATLHLTTADNGKTFTVKPQTQIVLTLPTNLSHGIPLGSRLGDGRQPPRSVRVVQIRGAGEEPARRPGQGRLALPRHIEGNRGPRLPVRPSLGEEQAGPA